MRKSPSSGLKTEVHLSLCFFLNRFFFFFPKLISAFLTPNMQFFNPEEGDFLTEDLLRHLELNTGKPIHCVVYVHSGSVAFSVLSHNGLGGCLSGPLRSF